MQLYFRACKLIFLIALSLPLHTLAADSFTWRTDIESAIRAAQRENKLVLLHFWDYHCPPCRRLEKNVFPRQDVAEAIEANFIPVKINVTDSPRLQQEYQIQRWPTDIILDANQQQLHRDISEQSPEAFIAILNQMAIRKNSNSTLAGGNTDLAASPTTPQRPELTIDDSRQSSFRIADNARPSEAVGDFQLPHPSTSLGTPTIPNPEVTPSQAEPNQDPAPITGTLTDEGQVFPTAESPSPVIPVSNTQQTPTQPPPLGLDGFCPVTLAGRAGKFPQWQPGHPKWGAIHRGQLYLFVGPDEQREFLQDPDRYSPVLAGRDVVRLIKHGEKSTGERRHGVTYRNRVYLFRDEYSLQEFRKAPTFFSREALKRMPIQR